MKLGRAVIFSSIVSLSLQPMMVLADSAAIASVNAAVIAKVQSSLKGGKIDSVTVTQGSNSTLKIVTLKSFSASGVETDVEITMTAEDFSTFSVGLQDAGLIAPDSDVANTLTSESASAAGTDSAAGGPITDSPAASIVMITASNANTAASPSPAQVGK